MDALRVVAAALVPGSLVLDSQPVSPSPRFETDGRVLGSLDQRRVFRNYARTEAGVREAVREGLLVPVHERSFPIVSRFDSVDDLLAGIVDCGEDTRVSPRLKARLERARPPVLAHERVRLRIFRRR